jgi:hypothetical protein
MQIRCPKTTHSSEARWCVGRSPVMLTVWRSHSRAHIGGALAAVSRTRAARHPERHAVFVGSGYAQAPRIHPAGCVSVPNQPGHHAGSIAHQSVLNCRSQGRGILRTNWYLLAGYSRVSASSADEVRWR